MPNFTFKRSAATLAVAAGLLATAGPASAILYNGHAGLGSSVYQHNQTDLEAAFSPQGPGSDGSWPGSDDALGATGVGSLVSTVLVDGTSNTLATALVAER
jgi:hypothetical protein